MIVDIGTGDGRVVLARAAAEPSALVIGVDAVAAAMAEASRRADRRGPANALFFAAGAEALPASPLAGRADFVTVLFPWGSLLRGIVGLDDAALRGVVSVLAPGGRLDVLASVVPSDAVPGLPCLDPGAEPAIRRSWSAAGLQLTAMGPASAIDLAGSGSAWARRLRAGGEQRPVWHLEGVRSASIGE
ncbi:MAG TPA: class I SAM-dependent methyltransferase [Candidatus Limnocylindrales bacterium]|nr:class I SAM-dependent methyltransferase [Candidatus Limnocylindrales bacterium]